MATRVGDTIREALSAGLREALEAESQSSPGGGGVSGATKLAAGAVLAAAATPLAKRGATALRTSSGGRAVRRAVDESGLTEKAARGITDANRAVQDWTARQRQKRGVLDNLEATEPRREPGEVSEAANAKKAERTDAVERFDRRARASRKRAASASSRPRITSASRHSPPLWKSSSPGRAKASRASGASPKSGSSASRKSHTTGRTWAGR